MYSGEFQTPSKHALPVSDMADNGGGLGLWIGKTEGEITPDKDRGALNLEKCKHLLLPHNREEIAFTH